MFIKHLLLKFEAKVAPERAKEFLQQISNQVLAQPNFKGLWINLDVDPM
jgi:hypothetical protein